MFFANDAFRLCLIACLTVPTLLAMKKDEQKPTEDKKDFHSEILEKFNGNEEELSKFKEGIREKEIFKLKRDLPKIESKKYEHPKLFHADSIAKVANINNLINEELSKLGKFYNSEDEKGKNYFLSRAGVASPTLLQEENKDSESSFEQAKLKTWLSLESKGLEDKLVKKLKVKKNPNYKSCPETSENNKNKNKMEPARKSVDIPVSKYKEMIEIPPEVPDLIKLSNSTDPAIEETPELKLKNMKNNFKKYITAKKIKHSKREISNENFSLLSIDEERDNKKSKSPKNKDNENNADNNNSFDNNSKGYDPNWWSQHYSLSSNGEVVLTEPYCINYGVKCKPIPVTSVPKNTDKILPTPIVGKITNKNWYQDGENSYSIPETRAENDRKHFPETVIIRKYLTTINTNRRRNVIAPVSVRDKKSKRAIKSPPSRLREEKEEKIKSNSKSNSNNSQKRITDSNNFKLKAKRINNNDKKNDNASAASNASKHFNEAVLANSEPLVNIIDKTRDKTENNENSENKSIAEPKIKVKKEKLAKNIDEIGSVGKISKNRKDMKNKKGGSKCEGNVQKSRCNLS